MDADDFDYHIPDILDSGGTDFEYTFNFEAPENCLDTKLPKSLHDGDHDTLSRSGGAIGLQSVIIPDDFVSWEELAIQPLDGPSHPGPAVHLDPNDPGILHPPDATELHTATLSSADSDVPLIISEPVISAIKSHIAGSQGPNSRGQTAFRVSKRKHKMTPSFSLDKVCKTAIVKGANSPSKGEILVFSISSSVKKPYDPTKAAATKACRDVGACKRCRRQRAKCGRTRETPYQLCKRCSSINPFLLELPCFVASLIEAQLFRNRAATGHPLEVSRKSVYDLKDIHTTTEGFHPIRLIQDVGEVLCIEVAEFVPHPGDKLVHVWKDPQGAIRKTPMPPYCIARLDQAKESMLDYIQRSRDKYVEDVKGVNGLTFAVFDEAQRYAAFNKNSTVRKALDLVAANRIIERDWHLLEQGTTAFDVVSDPDSPWYGKRPVTPMMDGQLDQIVIQGFLQPLRENLLSQLQTDINTSRKEKWFEIFLTVFILLANAEQLLAHSRRNAIRHGASGRYNSPELAATYFHACKMLVAYFHFACSYAMCLQLDWKSARALEMAKLDKDQVGFLDRLQGKVRNQNKALLDLRAGYSFEEPSYWTHQMFFENWNPGPADMEQYHISVAPALCA